jgi:hypothetical protein
MLHVGLFIRKLWMMMMTMETMPLQKEKMVYHPKRYSYLK